ncbi:MAG: ParA family protein [Phycisphaeraceae bacterium]|nr:MAG: ParA family protein [Phycisphaeraceae bacterium]
MVAFMNQKGGVGKTTTVVNLSAAIAEAGRSVLVLDLDPQAHATLHMGLEPGASERSIYDVLLDPDEAEHAAIEVRPNLAIIPAEVDQAAVEVELADAVDRRSRLRSALEKIRDRYEFILIDCPPSLGLLTVNGLAAAREVIVPMQAHFLALQGVGKLLETVQLVGQNVNPKLRVSGIVLCMHEETTRHAREVVADLEQFFEQSRGTEVPWAGARVYRPAIRRNIKIAESPSFGQTVFEYARWCAGAIDYQQVAQLLMEEWDQMLARRGMSEQIVTRGVSAGTAERTTA